MRTARPGLVLSTGLAAAALAALAPAGIRGPVPGVSWVVWIVVSIASIIVLRRTRGGFVAAVQSLSWLLPTVLMLTLPTLLFAASQRGVAVAGALVARSLAAATAALATVTTLGPAGLIAGLRAVRLPARFVDVIHAMLVSLSAIRVRIAQMLRARTARGAGLAPWSGLASTPVATTRGFGRVTAALLLRSLERAEALERARRARGGESW
jgi:energy-coupling factor transporter transmembrane protein EcfT